MDYIIAADSLPLDERDDLFGLIESHDKQQIKLYVYNLISDICREVREAPVLFRVHLRRFFPLAWFGSRKHRNPCAGVAHAALLQQQPPMSAGQAAP